MIGAICFLAIGIMHLAFPRRVQKSEIREYEKLPAFFKSLRFIGYIKSRLYIWVARAIGLVAIAAGILAILAFLWGLFGPQR